MDYSRLLDDVIAIAREAGDKTLEFYRTDLDVEKKEDKSPVTEADHAADAIIVPALEKLTPDIPVVSEERVEREGRAPDISGGRFWLVDPLDGTREFINRRDEFTVNIGLIVDTRPVLGVLGVPAYDRLYAAAGPGTAVRYDGDGPAKPIQARKAPAEGIIVSASRSHANKEELDHYLADKTVTEYITAGSALKFCLVAEGRADLYPRFGTTMEWDTAAGHAIVNAAGGSVLMLDGKELRYAKPSFRNPHFLVRGPL
jgi:3'(2'), 5'-bisphosphate nucleotidase